MMPSIERPGSTVLQQVETYSDLHMLSCSTTPRGKVRLHTTRGNQKSDPYEARQTDKHDNTCIVGS